MKTFVACTVVLVISMFLGFYGQAFAIEIPDPMKEVESFVHTEDRVMVKYTNGDIYIATMEEMGMREFHIFVLNLKRPKGAPAIVLPERILVVKTTLQTRAGEELEVLVETTGAGEVLSLEEVATQVTEEAHYE